MGGIGREGGSEFEFELNKDFLGIRASTQDPTLSFHCTTLSIFYLIFITSRRKKNPMAKLMHFKYIFFILY